MEGLERLIGRSIGGKVTTSVEMERTTHSKSNARALAFSNVLVEANTQRCIAKIRASLQRPILVLESIGWDQNSYGVEIFFDEHYKMKNTKRKSRLRLKTVEVCLKLFPNRYVCSLNKSLFHVATNDRLIAQSEDIKGRVDSIQLWLYDDVKSLMGMSNVLRRCKICLRAIRNASMTDQTVKAGTQDPLYWLLCVACTCVFPSEYARVILCCFPC